VNLLRVEKVSMKFGPLLAVNNASLHLSQGEILGLIGPNGSGKSTLLHTICGRILATEGRIELLGIDITNQKPNLRASLGMGIKFQLARIYLEKTVRENILIALQASLSIWNQIRNRTLKQSADEIMKLASDFQLIDHLDTPARELSHGQRQWLELGMVLATKPKLLLLDEPTAGMSPKERSDTSRLIRSASRQCGVLIVEHDLDFIKELCDRICVIHHGEIVATGRPKEIENDERVKEVYLTRA